ncbi:MAG: PAC2 family protein [Promethearchaeota archaeon]
MKNIKTIQCTPLDVSSLRSPVCIVGMPGIADIGKFAVDQLIGLLNAEKYLDIIFTDYPAGAIVENSILSTPKAEVLVWRDPKGLRDLVLVTADAQAMTPRGVYEISDFIAALMFEMGVTKIISLGAFPLKKKGQTTPVIFVTSTKPGDVKELESKYKCHQINKGVIVGANGLIPTLAHAQYDLDGIVLLAETDNIALINEDITDLSASVELIKTVAQYLEISIKEKYSPEKINEMTKSLEFKRKKLEEEIDSIHSTQESSIAAEERSLYI